MRVNIQLVLCSDDGREQTVTDIFTLKERQKRGPNTAAYVTGLGCYRF
jgi:hypothetical protein